MLNMHGLQDRREAKAAKVREAQNLLDPAVTPYTKQVQDKVETLYAEIESLSSQIGQIEKALVLENDLNGPARDLSDREGRSIDESAHRISAAKKAFVKALRFGAERLSPEEASLISADAPSNRSRVQNVATSSSAAGGVLVPTIVMPSVLTKLKAFGGMRTVAKVLATSGGETMQWGTLDDTAAEGELVAEGSATTDDDLSFGSTSIGAWMFSSKTIPVSMQLLQDANADAESVVLDALTERLARGQNRKFTTGSGVGEPQGAVTAAALGITLPAGNTTAVTYDGLVDLYHSLDPAYRMSPSCAFMMNDASFKIVKKMKDGQGRPIWLPSTESGFKSDAGFDTLLGAKLVINQHMADMAANAKPILFGDFSKYLIRDVMDVIILRFTDSAYAKKAQVGFLAWARADGRLIDASNQSIKYLQNSAT